MFAFFRSLVVAIKTRTLFKDIPAHYQEAYRYAQTEKVIKQTSAFPLIMIIGQVATLLTCIHLPHYLAPAELTRFEIAFSAYSLFYCIMAFLSSRLTKIARLNLATNTKKSDTYIAWFVILYTLLETVNIVFENNSVGTSYRFVGITFILAVLPAFRKRLNVQMIFLLYSLSAIGVMITGPTESAYLFNPLLTMTIASLIAYVCGRVMQSNNVNAFVNNRDIVEANIRLEEANEKLNTVNDQLEQISSTDQLTKIANRRAFDEYVMHAWGLCQRSSQPITVLMMDIDHFKAYNDEFGHLKGDECLYRVAQSIKSNFSRAVDLFARYGGEEFVAVLPFTTGESVMGLIERIRSGVEEMKIPNPKSQSSPYVTISIGVATRVPFISKQYDSIVSLADDALYQAKRTGRNRVVANLTEEEISFVAPRAPVIAVPGAGEDLAKLQSIVQMTMIAVFSVDLDTGKLSFSKSIIDFTGIESSELENYLSFVDYVHPDERSAFEGEMIKILSHEGELDSVMTVFRMRKADGQYNWVSMTCSYMNEDVKGDNISIVAVGSISDFSEQMRTQEITELMAAGSATYLYYYDFTTRKMFFNQPFCEDFQIENSLMDNGRELFYSFVYEPERQLFLDAMETITSGAESAFNIEVRLVSPSKGMRWVSMRGRASRGPNGRPSILAGSVQDTTEQVTARQTNRLIIEGCSDCVYVYDAETDVIEFSSKIKEITHVPDLRCEEGMRVWTELIVPEDRQMFLESMSQIRTGKADSQRLEFRVFSPGGEPLWIASRGKAAFNEQGQFIRMAGSIFNISAMGNYNMYIEELSMADRLTGLPNRLSLYRDMNQYLPTGSAGYIIMLDVDDFKNVNSMFGLGIGDRMLTELGALLTLNIPPDTSLYHLGSDLFIVHLKKDDGTYAFRLADQLGGLSSYELLVDDKSIRFTFSIGVVRYTPENTVDEIITNAEIANRKAKEGGKNRVMPFDPADKNDYMQRLALEAVLRECIDRDYEGFQAFFQPFYSTKTKTIVGAEALLRWCDSEGNVVPPNIVIPCLQSIGQFHAIESWVLRSAAKKCGEWLQKGVPGNFIINVNLSPVRAIATSLLDEVKGVIDASGLREHNVVLEITEESLIMEMQANIHMLRELQVNGILLAIDDFGTGYSSLSYLRDLPINEIKIDRSFILDIENNPSSRDFVKSIILLSHSMGYIVCVEGAETKRQVEILTELGADILQGYYFARPLSADEFEEQFLASYITAAQNKA